MEGLVGQRREGKGKGEGKGKRIKNKRLTRVSSDGGDLGGTEEESDGGEEGCDGELHCWRVVNVQVTR